MRVSLAGGGTDLSDYYSAHGGMVVSMAIDKYVYVFLSPNGNHSLHISSSDHSAFLRYAGDDEAEIEGKLRYARVFLREFGIRHGYSLFMASEMPPGTGLGSSSSLAVALTKALAALRDDLPSKAEIADRASHIEVERLAMPIGKQDHYAAAFGGVNAMHFSADGVRVEKLVISEKTRHWLTSSLLMFFTEQAHDSRHILAEQKRRTHDDPDALAALDEIKGHAVEVREALLAGDVEAVGPILHRTWKAKRSLAHGITNDHIDSAYDAALDEGATGGKVAGAGGGGFLLLACERDHQVGVSRRLEQMGLRRVDFHLDSGGASILVNNAAS